MAAKEISNEHAEALAFRRDLPEIHLVAEWLKQLTRFGSSTEDRFDALKLRLRKRAGLLKEIQLLPYQGFGNEQFIYLKGRVLKTRPTPGPDQQQLWHNVLATYRRLHSVEIPDVEVRVSVGLESISVKTDAEGYFECHIKNPFPTGTEPWRNLEFRIITSGGKEATATKGKALIPPVAARFGVISDIDDTILVTNAPSLLRAARHTFLQNARGRVAFPGVAALYRAFQRGTGPGEFNPIFYVSSGPWNLYDLLVEFMDLKEIPAGPILLQDYGLDNTKMFSASHFDHKLSQIKKLLETYPRLPFILIGDSGQRDPEIYRNVLEEVPNRIKAVYIRNVSSAVRADEVRTLAQETKMHGGELLLVANSAEAAKDALDHNYITKAAFEAVLKECELDLQTEAATGEQE
jgi:phosphatidate phosphatase APP1